MPSKRPLRPLLALAPYVARYRGRAFLALIALTVAAITTLLVPVAVRRMIDFGFTPEGIALIRGAKNPELGKKLIDWATSPAMQNNFAKYKINFVPAHPDVVLEPSLAAVLKGAKIFPIDAEYAGANRKRIVDRWVAEVLNQ